MEKRLARWVVSAVVWGAVVGLGGGRAVWGADVIPPSAPSGLTATTKGPASIRLSWVASSDDVTPQASLMYCMYVAETEADLDLSPDIFCALGVTTHLLTQTYGPDGVLRPLEPGTTYFIRVHAFDSAGNRSAASNVAWATTVLKKSLGRVTIAEATYIRDVLRRDWERTRNAGASMTPFIRASSHFSSETYTSPSAWKMYIDIGSFFTLQGVMDSADKNKDFEKSSQLILTYGSFTGSYGRLTAEIWPSPSNSEKLYMGKVKGVTGFSVVHDRDSSGNNFTGHTVKEFTQTTTVSASVLAWGLPYYLDAELELARTGTGSVRLDVGHRWYSEVELTDEVTGLQTTVVTKKWKKKKRSFFSSTTETKTVTTTDVVPFKTRLTTMSAGDGLLASLNVDTSRPKLDVANPGKIFPPWLPMQADLRANLDWSVTVDANPLLLFISDHGITSGPALEGTVREVKRLFSGTVVAIADFAFDSNGLGFVGSQRYFGNSPAAGISGTDWLKAWLPSAPIDRTSPTAPGGLVVSRTPSGFNRTGTMKLNWTASSDNSSGSPAILYAVWGSTTTPAATGGRPWFLVGPGVETKTFDDPAVRATYYFRVSAIDKHGNVSADSAEVAQSMPEPTTPRITALYSAGCNGWPCIVWETAADDRTPHSDMSYVIEQQYRSFGVVKPWVVYTTALGVTQQRVAIGGTGYSYCYRLRALDRDGNYSDYSNTACK